MGEVILGTCKKEAERKSTQIWGVKFVHSNFNISDKTVFEQEIRFLASCLQLRSCTLSVAILRF